MALKQPQLETFVFRQSVSLHKRTVRPKYGWRLRAKNGQIQMTAGESFTRLDAAKRAALRAQVNMTHAVGIDVRHTR